jgi:hypothetical protein
LNENSIYTFNLALRLRGVLSSLVDCEVNPYDSCLPERVVTLGCTQSEALTVPENAQRDLYRGQAVIVESANHPEGERLKCQVCPSSGGQIFSSLGRLDLL